ncbi:hypothetical protein FACS189415_8220 [Bacteroidia bacterium]|nr:hypothetical protein FACS189415_8220 [Bacteroidia bacterium]
MISVDFSRILLHVMRKFLLIVSSLLIITSCTEDENLAQESVSRTLIVYLAADNDLSADALDDIDEMKQGFSYFSYATLPP